MSNTDVSLVNAAPATAEAMLKSSETKGALPLFKMLLLGILAGMFIAFGAQLANLASHNITAVGIQRLVMGCVFPIGLIMVIILGAELFTGNCMMVAGLVDKRIGAAALVRNWVVVYLGNFIGSLIVVGLVYAAGQWGYSSNELGAFTIKVAAAKAGLAFGPAFASGICCNVLVCLAVLLGMAAKTPVGKAVGAFVPVMTFVTSGFEHSIANMYYLFAGLLAQGNAAYADVANSLYGLAGAITASGVAGNLVAVTLGNIVGGCCVGLVYWYCYGRKQA